MKRRSSGLSPARIISRIAVAPIAPTYMPPPVARPMPATAHRLAAVVSPRITSPRSRIDPAPRKPMPETTCAATRDGSRTTPARPCTSAKPNADTSITSAEPTETSMCVRRPAAQFIRSRSKPITLPSSAASSRRPSSSTWLIMIVLHHSSFFPVTSMRRARRRAAAAAPVARGGPGMRDARRTGSRKGAAAGGPA